MSAAKNQVGLKSDKEWRDAIRKAVHELRAAEGDGKARKERSLRLLARKLVSRGLEGDIAALREIGDRLDGKAHQHLALTGEITLIAVFALIAAREGAVIEGEVLPNEPQLEASGTGADGEQ